MKKLVIFMLVLGTASLANAHLTFTANRQESIVMEDTIMRDDLYGLKIDDGAETVLCRTLPFLAALPEHRGKTQRIVQGEQEIIPVEARADTLYLLGMTNEGWDFGVAHWGEHPELRTVRNDQVYIGSHIGELEIRYADGSGDHIPIVMGATAWFFAQWAYGPTHRIAREIKEPFASRPEFAAVLAGSMKIKESKQAGTSDTRHCHYFLAVKPRAQKIETIIIHNNPAVRGRPLVSAITLAGANPADGLKAFGRCQVSASDLDPAFESNQPGDWSKVLTALADTLYTKESDLPGKVKLVDFPKELDAARIRFLGGVEADMLSNIWVANLAQINDKFDRDTGYFHETGKHTPWYGGYSGIGTWTPVGVYYHGAFGRTSEHYVTLALRCIKDSQRLTAYVDFVDRFLYFYRSNRDPNKGPANDRLDVEKYPVDAPPHWEFGINSPCARSINELAGDEEMDGHGSTVVGRWVAWRIMGKPRDDWLTAPRKHIYGKSRWNSTCDAADFICWLMDYTGMDVMWSEGESTGWGGNSPAGLRLVPEGMADETDPAKIKKNYANSDMYEPYPTYVCMTALRCSAQIAEAMADAALAKKWRAYADRLQAGMIRLLLDGEHGSRMWRVSPYSIYPSLQDSLVQAWFSIYYDGLDPHRLDPEMTKITRNTLVRQLDQQYGHAAVLGMGYGQGWLTKAALLLDEMDDAGPLLYNIAKYTYDKNMDYVDEKRGIDWQKWLWIIPEGTNILPDGRWYRIGDLSNGANQGPAMHALELCAGVDEPTRTISKLYLAFPNRSLVLRLVIFSPSFQKKKGLLLRASVTVMKKTLNFP
jgi:hypothetical protein